MSKKRDDEILNDYKIAWDSIRKAEHLKGVLASSKAPSGEDEKEDSEQVEEMVEVVHQIGKIDREAAVKKMLESLEGKKSVRNIRWLWKITGSVAALTALFVGWQVLFVSEPQIASVTPVIELSKITVPTIAYTEEDDSMVSFDSLDLKKGGNIGVVQEKKQQVADEKSLPAGSLQKIRYNKVIIPQGYTYKVQLPDGSSVTLNAGSELKFPVTFQDSIRWVELKGEGFFEVAKSEVPFVVKAGDTQVKVYGTSFNFFYSEELSLSEAVLLEGSIGMSVGSKEELKIVPNERVYHKLGGDVLQVEKVDAEDYIGWMGTSFKYHATCLERIAFDISRWYGVEISIASDLKSKIYTLEFDKSSSLEWVMQALGLITEQSVKKEGGGYVIY